MLPFNSALQRDGNHELLFSFRCRHLTTELTVLCTQSACPVSNPHRMTPYLLKYFHNTQHVLPQFMSGQACNVSLYLLLTNIRTHQSFLLSIVCSGWPSTDLYTRGCSFWAGSASGRRRLLACCPAPA